MEIEEFTRKLEAEFEDTKPGILTPDTHYRQMENWTSMHALIVIAFVDANFNVLLKGEDLRSTSTIRELHKLVMSRT